MRTIGPNEALNLLREAETKLDALDDLVIQARRDGHNTISLDSAEQILGMDGDEESFSAGIGGADDSE